MGEPVVWWPEEIARWPEAHRAFEPAFEPAERHLVCEHVVEMAAGGTFVSAHVCAQDVECVRPMRCGECMELHVLGHGRPSCQVCDDDVAFRCSTDLLTPSVFVYSTASLEPTVTMMRGGIRAYLFLCERHGGLSEDDGGPREWMLPLFVDVLGVIAEGGVSGG